MKCRLIPLSPSKAAGRKLRSNTRLSLVGTFGRGDTCVPLAEAMGCNLQVEAKGMRGVLSAKERNTQHSSQEVQEQAGSSVLCRFV